MSADKKYSCTPLGSVVCNNDHTVTITITNVTDLAEFNESDWRIDNKTECEPTFSIAEETVTYTNLPVATCSSSSVERDNDILYVFEIRALVPGSEPTQALDHMFDASCVYGNNDTVASSFQPLTNRADNASDSAFFTFTLGGFRDADFMTSISGPVALDQPLYFKAEVETSSSSPNLDLFIISCHSSKDSDPASDNGTVVLIQNGCGNDTVHQDAGDTFFYNCTRDSIEESFSIQSFRYFGVDAGQSVFIHCELKVCLDNTPNSECECPSVEECDPNARKRRSVSKIVVHRVKTGPYYFADEEEKLDDEDRFDDTRTEDKGSFYLNLAIILAVSGIVISAITCLTVFLLLRKRQQRFSVSEARDNKACDVDVKT
ncbi:ZP domain-containing protein-like [Oculina patagonica]